MIQEGFQGQMPGGDIAALANMQQTWESMAQMAAMMEGMDNNSDTWRLADALINSYYQPEADLNFLLASCRQT